MKSHRFAAITLLAVAVTGITAGTSYAQPAASATPVVSQVDHGVAFTSGLSPDHRGVTTTLQSGRFELTRDGSAVTATSPDGSVLARVPMRVQAVGRQFQLSPQIDSSGRTLTIRSADLPDATVSDVQAFRDNVERIQAAQSAQPVVAKDVVLFGCIPGLIAGAVIGGVIGAAIGALFLGVGIIVGLPVGVVIGAAIGCAIA